MACKRFTTADYSFYAAGTLEEPEKEELRDHLRARCSGCMGELNDAYQFWYIFASLTEKTQDFQFPEPSLELRDHIIGLAQTRKPVKKITRPFHMTGLKIAAGVVLTLGGAAATWGVGQYRYQRDIAFEQKKTAVEMAAVTKLQAENDSLRNLVAAARNAPVVFPGRDKIVSVQDPYLLRDLQRARQADAAISAALTNERSKATDLEKRLTQTTGLLAAATKDKEDANREIKKAFDASVEKQRGINQLSRQIDDYKAKMHDRDEELVRSRATLQAQTKALDQKSQIIALLESGSAAVVSMRGQTVGGTLVIADRTRLAFLPTGLPQCAPGRAYQLWMADKKSGGATSLGTFTLNKDGQTVVFVNKAVASPNASFTVTEEPAGGSRQPTGITLMTGSLKAL